MSEPEPTREISDAELEALLQARFAADVEAVMAFMQERRVDFRAILNVTRDGRIIANVVPVRMQQEQ